MPMALTELACDDKSLFLDLRLGDPDEKVTGRSRLDLDWLDWLWLCEIVCRIDSEASRDDVEAKGFEKRGEMGVLGFCWKDLLPPGTPGCIREVMHRAQSCRV